MIWPGMEPRSPWPLANTLPTKQIYMYIYHLSLQGITQIGCLMHIPFISIEKYIRKLTFRAKDIINIKKNSTRDICPWCIAIALLHPCLRMHTSSDGMAFVNRELFHCWRFIEQCGIVVLPPSKKLFSLRLLFCSPGPAFFLGGSLLASTQFSCFGETNLSSVETPGIWIPAAFDSHHLFLKFSASRSDVLYLTLADFVFLLSMLLRSFSCMLFPAVI